jgi:membrane associated rhomboid family serine protease
MLTPVVRTLILLNILAFVVTSEPVIDQFGLHSFLSDSFRPWQFLTHLFLHASFGHIFSNMIGLFVFGPMLERTWGPRRFLFFYMFCGLGAALLYLGVNYYEMSKVWEAVQEYRANPSPDAFWGFVQSEASAAYDQLEGFIDAYSKNPNNQLMQQQSLNFVNQRWERLIDSPMVGASGAIFGVIMAFGLLFPNTELLLLFPPIPIKAKYLVLFYGAYELYSGVYQAQSDNVAHFAHIGGMLFAFILVKYWESQRKIFY